VEAIYQHLGRYPDQVLFNTTPIDAERLDNYRREGAEVVTLEPEPFAKRGIEVVRLPLLGEGPHAQHDAVALAKWLCEHARELPSPAQPRAALA
jgi:hypothetical protein